MSTYIVHMKQFIFLMALFLGQVASAVAQSGDIGSWNIVNVKYSHDDKWSIFAEGQIRSLSFYDNFHYHEFKSGVNYSLHKAVKLTLGAGSYQTYGGNGNFELPKNNDEFRLWPQLVLFQEVGPLKVEQRYRTELRWTSDGYRNRFRYRFGLAYPFGKNTKGYKPFQLSVNNEIFFTDKEPYFERNRVQMTLNCKLSKNASVQLGYLQQFDYRINDETGRDFLVVGYYYEIFRKADMSAVNETELKDN